MVARVAPCAEGYRIECCTCKRLVGVAHDIYGAAYICAHCYCAHCAAGRNGRAMRTATSTPALVSTRPAALFVAVSLLTVLTMVALLSLPLPLRWAAVAALSGGALAWLLTQRWKSP